MNVSILGKLRFKSRVVKQTAYDSLVYDYGIIDNTMTLVQGKTILYIEWDVGEDEDYVEIGIESDGKIVTGYDGVFELPKESIQLLQSCGFDTKEVENNEVENNEE